MIICIAIAIMLAVLLVDRILANRKLSERMAQQQETNLELLKRIPVTNEGNDGGPQPLTVEKIADAVRMEGFFPEVEETGESSRARANPSLSTPNDCPSSSSSRDITSTPTSGRWTSSGMPRIRCPTTWLW